MLKRKLFTAVIFISVIFAVQTAAQDVSPGSILRNFANNATITINDNGNASLYPSNITVSGVSAFTRMTVRLQGFSHTFPDDVDIILVGPQGQRAVLMSDAGGDTDVTNQIYIFSQTATTPIPDQTALTTSNFRPANYQNGSNIFTDTFPAPGPGALTDAPADLFVFNGTNPNGIWSLYVVDDAGQDSGSITLGWDMVFTVPQVFTVTNTNDSGGGSLREAITLAQDGDLINFSTLFNTPQTINLLTALPDITRSITIQGTGANLLTVRRDFNAATNFRIFNINQLATNGVAISGMTITGGNAGSGNTGGGIRSQSHLTLTNVHVIGNEANAGGGVSLSFADGVFTNCTFSNNTQTNAGGNGGGIFFQGNGGTGTLRVINSTISGNRAVNGGGIANLNGRLEITNSTIANNTAVDRGGIFTFTQSAGTTATTTLRNTIVANNSPDNLVTLTVSGGGPATFQTLGFNLSDNYNAVFTPLTSDITSATPRLAPLALYGGQTPTHALLHGSPALNAGDTSGTTTDQRGQIRPFFGSGATPTSDIGAFESQTFPAIVVTNNNDTGAGSLRNAIFQLTGVTGSFFDIQFDNNFFNTPQTISLTSGQLLVNGNMNIIAPGANLLTVRRDPAATTNFRVFEVASGFTATLSGMTITGGNASDTGGGGILNDGTLTVTHSTISGNTTTVTGGGIHNNNNDSLTVTNSTISGNTATISSFNGGGISNSGRLTVINSTISGNSAPNGGSNGGGIYSSTGTTIINSTTITNNFAAGGASGVYRNSGTINIRNSIIAGNVGNDTQPDVAASGGTGITSNGFNLIGNRGAIAFNQTGDQSGTGASPLNPLLGTLQNNGGTTATHALLFSSPAFDKGNSSGATSDQRGLRRPFDLPNINNTSEGADIGAFEAQTAPVSRAPFDYDGDNKTDISIFRPGSGEWWYLRSSDLGARAVQFGQSTDRIVPADYTGDGKTDIAFWRPSTGEWFILRSEDNSFYAYPFGSDGDIPAPADFDGDGKADTAVFRPSNSVWYILRSSDNQVAAIQFGVAEDKPVVADYDGDGKADIAIFRPSVSEWWMLQSTAGLRAVQFGQAGDKAVQGDYTGDGKADIAIWRPSNGNWFILRSEDNSFFAFPFGLSSDIATPGDYDGDGKFDAAVFRPSNSTWYLQRSTGGFTAIGFGVNGDIPTPNAYVP